MRNLGLPDHGLIRGSSASFAGINIPVVGETPPGKNQKEDILKLRVRDYETPASAATQNPYFLPWAMRGLLEEDFVKKELGGEVEELLGLFEDWKPTAKQLKEVKFRLEAVRSKL